MSFQPQEQRLPTLTRGLLECETAVWAFCWVRFSLSWFSARWASCHFPCTGFSLRSASTWELLLSWASAVLGFCLMGAELRLFQPGYIQEMHHRCQGSVQFPRFRLVTAKIWSDGHGPVLHLSVTPQCYSSVLFGKQRKIHPLGVRAGQPKRREEKRDVSILFF